MTAKTTDCVEWPQGRDSEGYGRLYVDGKSVRAHRYVYATEIGPIPQDLCVLHRCDNPPCVNPEHLFLGTNQDNIDDKMNKGRWGGGRPIKWVCPQGHDKRVVGFYQYGTKRRCAECGRVKAREAARQRSGYYESQAHTG